MCFRLVKGSLGMDQLLLNERFFFRNGVGDSAVVHSVQRTQQSSCSVSSCAGPLPTLFKNCPTAISQQSSGRGKLRRRSFSCCDRRPADQGLTSVPVLFGRWSPPWGRSSEGAGPSPTHIATHKPSGRPPGSPAPRPGQAERVELVQTECCLRIPSPRPIPTAELRSDTATGTPDAPQSQYLCGLC